LRQLIEIARAAHGKGDAVRATVSGGKARGRCELPHEIASALCMLPRPDEHEALCPPIMATERRDEELVRLGLKFFRLQRPRNFTARCGIESRQSVRCFLFEPGHDEQVGADRGKLGTDTNYWRCDRGNCMHRSYY